jgi:hypothetical protein
MKSNNNNTDDDNNNTAMGSVHARGDTFLTFGLKALTETNTSRLATASHDAVSAWVLSHAPVAVRLRYRLVSS